MAPAVANDVINSYENAQQGENERSNRRPISPGQDFTKRFFLSKVLRNAFSDGGLRHAADVERRSILHPRSPAAARNLVGERVVKRRVQPQASWRRSIA